MKKSLIFLLLLLTVCPSPLLRAADQIEDDRLAFEDEASEGLVELGEEEIAEEEVPAPAPVPKAPVVGKTAAALKPQTQQDVEVQKILAAKPAVASAQPQIKSMLPTVKAAAPQTEKIIPSMPPVKPAAVREAAKTQVPAPSVNVQAPAVPALPVQRQVPQIPQIAQPKTEFSAPPIARDGLYRFVDYFPEVEAKIFNKKSGEFLAPGMMQPDGKILFKGYEAFGDVSVIPVMIQGETEKAFSFNLIPGSMHQLLFKDFHPGQKLTLQYILLQRFPTQTPQFVYLKILVGEKEVKRIQIASNESWKKETLDLGIVSFLNKGVSFRFEVSSDDSKGLRLDLISQLKN